MKEFLRKILIVVSCGLCLHATAQLDSTIANAETKISADNIEDTSLVFVADVAIKGNKKNKALHH